MVQLQRTGAVGIILMNRPEKRNALSPEMVQSLQSSFEQAAADPGIRSIVLRGNGPAFCAGADLAYLQKMATNSSMENLADSFGLMTLMRTISECPKPVIAMVHGPAIAGGCGLATVCDFVIAGTGKARFGYSEVAIGFVPAIVMVFLLRRLSDTQARRLVLSAEIIQADEAVRIGLATRHVADDYLESEVMHLAEHLVGLSADSIALSKQMFTALHGMSIDAGLSYAATVNAFARSTQDCQNGIANFLNKQKT